MRAARRRAGAGPPANDAKVRAALELWVPAVNNEKRFGRWAFLEIDNPDKAMGSIRDFLTARG